MKISLTKYWPLNADDYQFHVDVIGDNGASFTPVTIKREPYRNHPSDGLDGRMDTDETFLNKATKAFEDYVEQQKQLKTKAPVTIKEIEI